MIFLRTSGGQTFARSSLAFSLVELMIVITILGALVAIIIPAFSYSEQSAKADAVTAEMRQLRQSFAHFYQDNYPSDIKLQSLATYGLWPLFSTNALPAELASVIHDIGSYDVANRLGWRGPYALAEGTNLTVCLQNGQPPTGAAPRQAIPVVYDPYGGYYRVLAPEVGGVLSASSLYLVCTGPDRTLQINPAAVEFGRIKTPSPHETDDTLLPLKP